MKNLIELVNDFLFNKVIFGIDGSILVCIILGLMTILVSIYYYVKEELL